jgi:hypothetical protein
MTADHSAQAAHIRRPLGLSLAIISAAIFYGVGSLVDVYILRRMDAVASQSYLMGGVEMPTWTVIEGLLGGIMLIACILSWWGHPPQIRFFLMGLLLLLAGINMYRIIDTWLTPLDPIFGGQSQEAVRASLRCRLPINVGVPLYVLWYLDRAPARAFYRRIPLDSLASSSPAPAANTPSNPGRSASE